MVARFSRCERRPLELVVANRLDEGEAERLSRHVQTCPHCQNELEQLAGSREWWEDARTFLSSTDDVVAIDPENSDADESALDFLEPANDPALLGRLGSYQIEEVIGRGGMGLVLKARDPALDRTVAIKLLATPLAASAAARKRFGREAKAAAAVVHDHVIPIHSVDTSGPVPFLVMPYIAGRSLQDRLDAVGPLETKEVLRIALQTARGLAAAHAQGLVHRDIKPANILLENGVERVRITDFGLARTIDDASQSQSGYIAGTPQYMAPEQARGEPSDARADLFSLGSVMYAMCAGHPPFRAETTLAVLRRICDDTPRPLREVNADVPAWLAASIHRLLAKSSDERFQSAHEVAEFLEQWLAHLQQPTVIPPPAFVDEKFRERPSHHGVRRRLFAATASIATLVLLLAAMALWNTEPSTKTSESSVRGVSPVQLGPPAGRRRTSPVAAVPNSLQSIDAQLQQIWQETLVLEAPFVGETSGGVPLDQAISDLQQRLQALEGELQQRPRATRLAPETQPLESSN